MIMSGWILPDMYSVKCNSCSNTKEHTKIIKRYLDNLKHKDYQIYQEIMQEFFKLRTGRKIIDLEDFAVMKLGWIKVIDFPIKIVFYSPESPIELLIERYKKIGYTTISTFDRQSIINVCISSQELI